MKRLCKECMWVYDDEFRLTYCPHQLLNLNTESQMEQAIPGSSLLPIKGTETMNQEPVPEEDRHRENAPLTKYPRAFILQRDEDVSGVSGTGVVAWGVEFPDGVCALRWTSQWPTSVVFHDKGMEGIQAVHGHDGKTKVIYIGGMGE